MSAPQPPINVTRQYLSDDAYTADATNMAASGWRVTDLRRLPDNTIMVTYTYGPATVPVNPPSGASAPPPGAPTVPSFTAFPPQQPAQRPIQPFPSTADHAVVGRNSRIILGVIAGVVILCCVVGGINSAMSSTSDPSLTATVDAENASANATATASAVSAEATQAVMSATEKVFYATATANALKSTPTPAPALVFGARLGGLLSDFDATYGAEASQGMWDTTIAGQQVQLVVTITHSGDSLDGQDRVVIIDIDQLSGPAWGATTDAAIVASFLPRDAININTTAGWGSLGPDHIYRSRQLANSLAASVFQNSANQRLPPGTFDWQCSINKPICEVAVGTNS